MRPHADLVFKALADPTRRHLLDRLREHDGQTLTGLCEHVAMARQSVTQHLGVLEAANLISTTRRGRERLHHLNPVPIHAIQRRWIDKFELPRLDALAAIKQRAEEPPVTDQPTYVYTTYIESTPERVWEALTDADLTAEYWGHRNVSDWQVGSSWEHQRIDGSGIADITGEVVESVPPTRLVTTWRDPQDPDKPPATVTFALTPYGDIVRLTVTHEHLDNEHDRREIAAGWPAVLSNLKTFVETGHALPVPPWEAAQR